MKINIIDFADTYFMWLCNFFKSDEFGLNKGCIDDLKILHCHEFKWVDNQPLDENRMWDGRMMRRIFVEGVFDRSWNVYKDYFDEIFGEDYGCSVLEMIVGLGYKMERDIMHNRDYGDRCYIWCGGMIDELGISDAVTFGEADKLIDRFLNRKYDRHGRNGGLFYLENPPEPAYKMGIWEQMVCFLDENYSDEFGGFGV